MPDLKDQIKTQEHINLQLEALEKIVKVHSKENAHAEQRDYKVHLILTNLHSKLQKLHYEQRTS